VLHVREADSAKGPIAIEQVRRLHSELGVGPRPHAGDQVLELMARPSNKGDGLDILRTEFAPVSTVFLGDDIPDEEAFERLGPRDIGIKIGTGPSRATHRMSNADAARSLLHHLVARLA
jgi:trehalose 6-phosphate phosphatase